MSVARVTTLNFKSKEGADQIEETYKTNAPTEFAAKSAADISSENVVGGLRNAI